MNMLCRNRSVTVRQRTRGTRIRNDGHFESKVPGGARGGIHTHVRHHAGDDDIIDVERFELI